jgi:N6-adenosine-specific RNA methylase IME4
MSAAPAPIPFQVATPARAMQALTAMEAELSSAKTFDAIRKIERNAEALKILFRDVTEVKNQCERVVLVANRRIGAELEAIPKATPNPQKPISHASEIGSGRSATGVPKDTRSRLIKLAAMPMTEVQAIAAKIQDAGKDATVNAVLRETRETSRAEKKHNIATAGFSSDGPFDCVVIDPPWPMQKIDRDVRPNQDAFDYPVMSLDEIQAFWLREIAPKTSYDCHVFLWTTQKFLPVTFKLFESWGLKYVFLMTWLKPGGFQPIGLPQFNTEFAVYSRKGTPIFVDTKNFSIGFQAPRREHSRKPDEFYDLVRRVTGGSRLDVFSREPREGFAQYGNEIKKFKAAS